MKLKREIAGSMVLALALPVFAAQNSSSPTAARSAGASGAMSAGQDASARSRGVQGMDSSTNSQVLQSTYRATDLIGKPIQDAAGMKQGTIKDVVMSEDRHSVAYVAVALIDSEAQYVQVQLADIQFSANQQVVSDLSASQGSRTTFSEDAWPAGDDQRRLSKVLGMDVHDAAGNTVGQIRDALLRSDTGAIDEATVGIGGVLGVGEKFASLDWKELTFQGEQNFAQTDVAADQLQSRAYSKSEYWQRLGYGDAGDTPLQNQTSPSTRRSDSTTPSSSPSGQQFGQPSGQQLGQPSSGQLPGELPGQQSPHGVNAPTPGITPSQGSY